MKPKQILILLTVFCLACSGMQYLKQSTAATVKLGPFVDNSDGNTPETALDIDQSDVRLSKEGGNFAQKNDANNNSVHDEYGWYDIKLDATDTNTPGRLLISVQESGALPVWQEYSVLPANVYDSMFGSDKLQVDISQVTTPDPCAAALYARLDPNNTEPNSIPAKIDFIRHCWSISVQH
ncbi:MAG: hypothetical protein PHH26_00680 [Candidatus Thermoplasmatota archaeon]|nr:hypothetical protein [Candidatus Thermoplasmatota archaeon]